MTITQLHQTNSSLNKDLDLVKEQVAFHEAQAERHADNPYRQNKHLKTAARFRALEAWVEGLLAENQALKQNPGAAIGMSKPKQLTLALTPDDLNGLPEHVIEALGLNTGDRTDLAIVTLLNESGGILTLDKILIGLYRRTKEIHKRQPLVQRLYRMSQKGLAFPVPGKKGVYSTQKLTDEEVERLFDN